MQIPSKPARLTAELRVEPREVDARAWQAHVLKHPFGLGALYGLGPLAGGRRWNAEGWDATEPPTITREERAETVVRIRALKVDGERCGASRLEREEYRGDAPHARMPCYACSIARRCEEITREIGERYAGALTRALEALADPLAVRRGALAARLMQQARHGVDPSALVLSVGRLGNGDRGARISAASGIRSELYLERGALRWRTTYKEDLGSACARVSFLKEVLQPITGLALSDQAWVPRRWWETIS